MNEQSPSTLLEILMHKIFCTPELLDEILSKLSQHTCTVAARVCKLWFAHSIQFVWDTVNINYILRVLSPFNKDGFQQPLLSESWSRFLLYSKNIRQLECFEIQYAALRQALLWRPNGDLFSSKLTVLQWEGPWEYIECLPSLVTSTLQKLQVELHTIKNANTVDVFYRTIPLRSPSLRSFELSFPPVNNDTHAVSQSLGKLFSHLSEIISILLPSHCITEDLFTTLSQLPQLRYLSLYHCRQYPHILYTSDDVPKRKIDDGEETRKDILFHSLESLYMYDSDFMIAEALRRGVQLLRLVDLTYSGSSPNHTSLELLHRTCPNLEKILILADDGLPFQAIRSLLNCPALIKIVSRGTIDMELEDLVTIATNRSSWKVITLPSVKPLSYHALVPFAQHCPDLYELGLTLDFKLGFPDLDVFTTDVKFSSLTLLDVGFSDFTPNFELALFLSKTCSKPIKIRGCYDSWETVEKMVNFIITTQLEIRTLKDENMLLHAQKYNHNF